MAIDPVTGMAIASAGVNLLGGLYSQFKKDDKVEDESGMMLSNMASMQNIAEDLRSRQGLPDTVIGRMERQVSQGASQIAAESMQLGRQSVLASPILIDQLAQQALDKSRQFLKSGTERIEGLDIQALEANLAKAMQARSQTFQASSDIAKYKTNVEKMNQAIEQAKMQNMANMFGSAATSMVTLAGTGGDVAKTGATAGAQAGTTGTPLKQSGAVPSALNLGQALLAPGTLDLPAYNLADDTEMAYLNNLLNFS